MATIRSSASGAAKNTPYGVAVDGEGNVYIADTGNGRVLKETYAGAQSVVATTSQPRAVAVDSAGVVYIADLQQGVLSATPNTSGTYRLSSVGSSVASPNGIAVDNTFIYVSDSRNHQVLAGHNYGGLYIEKKVGSGNYNPGAVAVDGLGNVSIADVSTGNVLAELMQSTAFRSWRRPAASAIHRRSR